MSTATSASRTPPTFGEAALLAHPGRASEPAWLGEQREAAFASYEDLLNRPLDPEEWKRVDLRSFQPGKFRLVDASPLPAQFQSLMDTRAEFAGIVSHVDGHRVESRLDPALASRGVLFGSLHELAQSHGDLLKAKLFSAVRPDADRMAAWHAAFLTGGTVLYVPRNVELRTPLYSLIGLDQAGAADFSHNLVILEDGAQATLLEETASTTSDRPGLHVGSVELLVGQGARLRYVQLQNWNQQTFHFAHQMGRVARDASLQWTVGGIGSRLSHVHQDVVLDGPGASGEVN
ncbi:MAG: SufD family Fe-S cluster assembly protein, partial [Verrucomicrobiota bacterium]